MRKYRLCIVLALAAVVAGTAALPAMAQLAAGTRALGMGGAYTAIADDTNAAYWNPAGLVNARGFSFQAPNVQVRIKSNLDWEDIADNPPTSDEDRIALLEELGQGVTTVDLSANFGIVANGLAVSIIPLASASLTADVNIDPVTNRPQVTMVGGVPTIDSTGLVTGVAAYAVGVSMGRTLKNGDAIGFTLKSVNSKTFAQTLRYDPVLTAGGDPTNPADYTVDENSPPAIERSNSGFGLDVGYMRTINPETTMGIMVRNLLEPKGAGPFGDRQFNIGFVHRPAGKSVVLAADIAHMFDHPTLNLGAELKAG